MSSVSECMVHGRKITGLFDSIHEDGYVDSTVLKRLRNELLTTKPCVDSKSGKKAIDQMVSEVDKASALDAMGKVGSALELLFEAELLWLGVK